MRLTAFVAAALLVAAPVAVQAADVGPLVTADWVKSHAADENVVILDIRDKVDETTTSSSSPGAPTQRSSAAPRASTGPSSISATKRSLSSMAAGASTMPRAVSASRSR